jgi:hypothetical protein
MFPKSHIHLATNTIRVDRIEKDVGVAHCFGATQIAVVALFIGKSEF